MAEINPINVANSMLKAMQIAADSTKQQPQSDIPNLIKYLQGMGSTTSANARVQAGIMPTLPGIIPSTIPAITPPTGVMPPAAASTIPMTPPTKAMPTVETLQSDIQKRLLSEQKSRFKFL